MKSHRQNLFIQKGQTDMMSAMVFMMKMKKSVMVIALTLALTFCFSVAVFGAVNMKEIKAYFNYDLKLKLDGQEQALYDANGDRVYPITYNGTTYLPIRAVSDMLGIDVTWDQANYSVLLGKTGEGVNLVEQLTPYSTYSSYIYRIADQKPLKLGDKLYNSFIHLSGDINGKKSSVYYNLEGKYDTLTFYSYSTVDITLSLYGDNGTLLKTVYITGKALPACQTVDVTGVQQLSFEIKSYRDNVYIFDAVLE